MNKFATLLILVLSCVSAFADVANRRMAVTFDDLPIVAASADDAALRLRISRDLLAALTSREIPAIGFVNEGKFTGGGGADPAQVDLLRLWLQAGFELGNHSFSHVDLHRVSLDEFSADVLLGEKVTRQLLADAGTQPRYFRHPFLHTGCSLASKRGLEAFLAEHGYRVAPVTIDNSEWIFARGYVLAIRAGDAVLARRIGSDYVEYMLQMVAYYEKQSALFFDRNIDHVLLVHANELNGDWFGVLADRLADAGYSFLTLDEALRDPAYTSADSYIGPGGITWLHRWAITAGENASQFRGEPETPQYIRELTQLPEHLYPNDNQGAATPPTTRETPLY